MGVTSPALMPQVFADCFNAGDLAGIVQLYVSDAIFTYDGAETATGRKQIEAALNGFLAAGLSFRGQVVSVYVVGDTALTRTKWDLLDASGEVAASGVSAEVQRRDEDGLWRFAIDDAGGGSRV
jgi:uncharacterized protein (TIGR02246 family)